MSNKDKIKKVTFYYDYDNKKFASFVVERENGQSETVNRNTDKDFDLKGLRVIAELENTYHQKRDELEKKGYFQIKDYVVKENNKEAKNIKINKKSIALIALTGIALVTVGVVAGRMSKPTNQSTTNKNTKPTVSTINNETWSYPTNTPTPTMTAPPQEEYYIPVMDEYVDVPFINSTYQDNVNFYGLGYEREEVIALKVTENKIKHIYTQNNYDCSLDNLNALARQSSDALFQYLFYQQGEKPNDIMLMNYEYLFTDSERALVEYFSKMRNKVVETLFMEGHDAAREIINQASCELVKRIDYNMPIQTKLDNGSVYVAYDDLSRDARGVILSLAEEISTALHRDNFEYDGFVYDQETLRGPNGILTEAIEQYKNSK